MELAYVGLGGNVGDAAALVRWAAAELGALRLSSLWRSAPVGPEPDQPWFVNAVAELAPAGREPIDVLDTLQALETLAGRDRARERRMGPRTLDLDLLLVGDQTVMTDRLTLPHPRLHLRAFALAPLVELTGPDHPIPGHGRAGDLLARALTDPAQLIARIV